MGETGEMGVPEKGRWERENNFSKTHQNRKYDLHWRGENTMKRDFVRRNPGVRGKEREPSKEKQERY